MAGPFSVPCLPTPTYTLLTPFPCLPSSAHRLPLPPFPWQEGIPLAVTCDFGTAKMRFRPVAVEAGGLGLLAHTGLDIPTLTLSLRLSLTPCLAPSLIASCPHACAGSGSLTRPGWVRKVPSSLALAEVTRLHPQCTPRAPG